MMMLRKFRYKNDKANAKPCVNSVAPHHEKNYTIDLTEIESSSDPGDRDPNSSPEEKRPIFESYLECLEEIEPQKIVASPDVLPGELWTVRYTPRHDEWKYWDIDELLLELSLHTAEDIGKINRLSPLKHFEHEMMLRRRLGQQDLRKWENLKADAEKALFVYLEVDGPDGFAALSEERLREHERKELWKLCSESSKSVLRWTWNRTPSGGIQNNGWRGLLRCVVTCEADELVLPEISHTLPV